MQELRTRAAAAAEQHRHMPFVGLALAAAQWARSMSAMRTAIQEDTATTDELLKEAGEFDINDKHYPLRARVQFARLARARRAGR